MQKYDGYESYGYRMMPIGNLFFRKGDLSSERLLQLLPYHLVVGVSALEVHQLGDGCFHGTVSTTDDVGELQLESRSVSLHLHASRETLADVDDVDASMGGLVEQSHDPRSVRCVARAVSSHHDASQGRRFQDVAYDAILDAWEEAEYDDVRVELEVRHHRLAVVGSQDVVLVEHEVDADIAEVRMVERVEGMESLGIDLGGAIASEQLAIEEDTHFWHHRLAIGILERGNFDGGHHVLLAVCAKLADRKLATREDDRLGEVLKHEGEGGGGVSHRVGAMQDDKAIVIVIIVGDDAYDLCPSHRVHVAGVDGRVELSDVDVRLNQLKFWHGRDEVIEVERLQCARDGILSHTDGTSCINDEYSWCCHLALIFNVSQFECKNSKKKSSMKKSCIFFRLIQKEMLLLQPI